MDLASVVAALASVGVRVSGSTPNNSIQGDSSRACPTGLAGPEPSGTHNDPGQHFQETECLRDVPGIMLRWRAGTAFRLVSSFRESDISWIFPYGARSPRYLGWGWTGGVLLGPASFYWFSCLGRGL